MESIYKWEGSSSKEYERSKKMFETNKKIETMDGKKNDIWELDYRYFVEN